MNRYKIELGEGEFVVSLAAPVTGYANNMKNKDIYAITNWGNLWVRSEGEWRPKGGHNKEEDIYPERHR